MPPLVFVVHRWPTGSDGVCNTAAHDALAVATVHQNTLLHIQNITNFFRYHGASSLAVLIENLPQVRQKCFVIAQGFAGRIGQLGRRLSIAAHQFHNNIERR